MPTDHDDDIRTNVVFDFGAVLFRFEPLAAVASVWPEQSADAVAGLAQRIFQGDWLEFDRGRLGVAEVVPRLAAAIGCEPSRIASLIERVVAGLLPMPDSLALLPRLRARGHRLFYLSNMPKPFAAALRADSPVPALFDAGLFSSDIHAIKPEPAIYAEAERRFGLVPARTLFIDDSLGNVDAARRRGWQAVRFVDAAQCAADLGARGWL